MEVRSGSTQKKPAGKSETEAKLLQTITDDDICRSFKDNINSFKFSGSIKNSMFET